MERSAADHEAKLRAADQYFQREAALSGVARNASNQRRNETFHGASQASFCGFCWFGDTASTEHGAQSERGLGGHQ